MSKRLLKEQLDYIISQRNLTLARKHLKSAKTKGDEAAILVAQTRYDKAKTKSEEANVAITRSGLSKSSG